MLSIGDILFRGSGMTEETVERGKIDLGRVIAETFRVIGRNIAAFTVLGLLLSGLPVGIVSFFQAGWARTQLAGISTGNFDFSPSLIMGSLWGGLAALITTAILQGALIYTTVQDLSGQKPSMGEALATGLRNFLPLIGLSILFGIGVICGFILLIVPGIMLLCAWIVAAPAMVADRTGVFGAFGRSAELTRGNRWSIFGLLVILWVVSIVLGALYNAVLGVPAFGGDPMVMVDRLLSPLGIVMAVIRQTVTTVVISAAVSVLYVELRRAREGLGPEWLREIFA
jgi:hypothetical protein